MKKFIALFVLFFVPFVGGCTEYKEGTHYVKVEGISSDQPEVREYFSFYCPHCFRFEPAAALIKSSLPDGVAFEKNHVDFLRGVSAKMQSLFTRAFIVAQLLDSEQLIVDAIFKYIHVSRATPTSITDIRNIFIFAGIEGEKFDQLIASEAVLEKASIMKRHQEALAKSKGITGVPTLIVNGKYRVVMKSLDKERFAEDFADLVKYLSAK